MNNEWIIDVLLDLRNFAEKQVMMDLAEHLDDAILIAAAEIRDLADDQHAVKVDDAKTGKISRTPREHRYS